MPPKWCGKSLGQKGIDIGMVGDKPSLVIWLDFVTWWCVGWKPKIMVLEKCLDSNLTNASKVIWELFWSKRNWSWHGWCLAKLGDLSRFFDLVVFGVKTETHGFGKVVGLKPHKCLQSDMGIVWEQKELILAWLVLSQVSWFGYILWLGGVWGEKQNSWFLKTGWTQSSQMLSKWCGKSLGTKGIYIGMVGA